MCPKPRNSDQVPVIIGTNANLFQRLADLCQGIPESPSAQYFRIQPILSQVFQQKQLSAQTKENDDEQVKWLGLGPLTLARRKECLATCKGEKFSSVDKDILLVESPSSLALPAGMLAQSFVLPSSRVDESRFLVLLQNESLKEISLPVGTVLAHTVCMLVI